MKVTYLRSIMTQYRSNFFSKLLLEIIRTKKHELSWRRRRLRHHHSRNCFKRIKKWRSMRLIVQQCIRTSSRVHFRLNSRCTVKISTPRYPRRRSWSRKGLVDAEIATLADDNGRARLISQLQLEYPMLGEMYSS